MLNKFFVFLLLFTCYCSDEYTRNKIYSKSARVFEESDPMLPQWCNDFSKCEVIIYINNKPIIKDTNCYHYINQFRCLASGEADLGNIQDKNIVQIQSIFDSLLALPKYARLIGSFESMEKFNSLLNSGRLPVEYCDASISNPLFLQLLLDTQFPDLVQSKVYTINNLESEWIDLQKKYSHTNLAELNQIYDKYVLDKFDEIIFDQTAAHVNSPKSEYILFSFFKSKNEDITFYEEFNEIIVGIKIHEKNKGKIKVEKKIMNPYSLFALQRWE